MQQSAVGTLLVAILAIASRSPPRLQVHESSRDANVVEVVAREFSFELPASIPAGLTTFRLRDLGQQDHHLFLVRVDSGKTQADLLSALKATPASGPPPTWLHVVGGPNTPGPGGESNSTVVLIPGRYIALCVIPSLDGVPHFMKGMMRGFTVTQSSRVSEPLPQADLTVTLTDFAFTFSHPLTRGHHIIAVVNRGTQPHEFVVKRYSAGEGNRELLAWETSPQGKPAPGKSMGGTTNIAPGETAVIQNEFAPGRYGLLCFTPDVRDGKPHFMHGMQTEFEVK